jgi:hypothetical protein
MAELICASILFSSSADSDRMSTSMTPVADMLLTDVPPETIPTLNVTFGLAGTCISEIFAIARPSA